MNFMVLINTLHGSTDPYVEKIFLEEFGCDKSSCVKTNVLPHFGRVHLDPNLTYAADLVKEVGSGKYSMGATLDGDMILTNDLERLLHHAVRLSRSPCQPPGAPTLVQGQWPRGVRAAWQGPFPPAGSWNGLPRREGLSVWRGDLKPCYDTNNFSFSRNIEEDAIPRLIIGLKSWEIQTLDREGGQARPYHLQLLLLCKHKCER